MSAFAFYGLIVAATLLVWWFSTGLIVYLDGLPKGTFRWSFGVTSGVAMAALFGLSFSNTETTVSSAALAFFCAILVWGWNEMAFLMGYITGPRPEPCPPGAVGFTRFRYAMMALIYHEVALVLSLGLIAALTLGQANQFGLWTFALLWVMRLSSKFNLFLGVPNRTEEFLPEGLSFLKSYFRNAAMNPLLPIAITIATVCCVLLVQRAAIADTGGFEAVGFTLLSALLALAILEHWLMVVPIPASLLWGWGLRSHEAAAKHRASEAQSESSATTQPPKTHFADARKQSPVMT